MSHEQRIQKQREYQKTFEFKEICFIIISLFIGLMAVRIFRNYLLGFIGIISQILTISNSKTVHAYLYAAIRTIY